MTWILTIISIIGSIFNAYKKPICFYIWIAVNIGWFIYDCNNREYGRACLDGVQTIICIIGITNAEEKRPMNFEVITLCGSTKFKDLFLETARKLTLEGKIILMPNVFGHSGDIITDEQKEKLDKLHKQKINLSHAIYVLNKDGYIGESTRSEIEYAKDHNKKIYYLEEVTE